MANTVRTNISVPVALKARMEKTKEAVNWSAVACEAFERKLDEIQARKEVRKMDDVIERLRASKRQSAHKTAGEGAEAGRQWAKHRAEAIHLERLDRMRGRSGHYWDQTFDDNVGQSAYSGAELFVFAIEPEHDKNRTAASDFWGEELGDEWRGIAVGNYVQAFADGALEIWDEVSGKI